MLKKVIAAFALTGAALALVGCGSQGTDNGGEGSGPVLPANEVVSKGAPDGWPGGMDDGPSAGWIEDGATFAVVTWGSSSCPPVAETMQVLSEDHLILRFMPPAAEVCTADFAPTTHEFELPDGLTKRPITLTTEFVGIDDPATTEESVTTEEFKLP